MSAPITHHRKLLGMAKNWALTTLPGWSDSVHRDLLARHGAQRDAKMGRYSATTMTLPQLLAALADYEALGWTRAAEFLAGYGGQVVHIPLKKESALGLTSEEWGGFK